VSYSGNSNNNSDDVFSIQLSNGYTAGGNLTSGNIQIH
jgi:hypothetical protein